MFCTRYGSANASSARGSSNFGPLADLSISVFREVSINTVFTKIHTSRERRLQRWFTRRTGVWFSVFRNSVIHKIFSELLQPLRDFGTKRVSPFLIGVFVFIWFLVLDGFVNSWSSEISEEHGFPRSCLSTRLLDTVAGWGSIPHGSLRSCLATLPLDTIEDVMGGEVDELEEDVGWSISCLEGVMDVEEGKLEEELVDKTGTTIGTKFSVLHCFRIPFLMRCGFWPLIHSYEYPCSSQSFPSDKTAGVSSRTFMSRMYPILWRKLWPLHVSALPYWLFWLLWDFSTSFPFQRSSSPFLLIMCIDAPESRTNSLSSGLRIDGAGRHQFSEGVKNAVLSFSFNFRIFLLLHGHIALAISSLLETDPQILKHWGYADEGHLGKSFQAMDFGLECQRDVRRLLWILHIGLVSVCLSSSAKSIKTSAAPYLKYATQLSCTWWVSVQKRSPCSLMLLMPFQHGHCTFVAFFRPFARLFFCLAMRIRALFPKSASILGLVEPAFWRMPFFTEWIGASSFEVILARQSSHLPTWASASRTSGSRCIFHILPRRRSWRRIWLCHFCTLLRIVSETAILSFRTLPVSFPLPTISKTSLFTLFCPLILDHGACLIISVSGLKNSSFVNSGRYFFLPLSSICDNQV